MDGEREVSRKISLGKLLGSSLKRCKPSSKKVLSENMKMNFICTFYLRVVYNDFKTMGTLLFSRKYCILK